MNSQVVYELIARHLEERGFVNAACEIRHVCKESSNVGGPLDLDDELRMTDLELLISHSLSHGGNNVRMLYNQQIGQVGEILPSIDDSDIFIPLLRTYPGKRLPFTRSDSDLLLFSAIFPSSADIHGRKGLHMWGDAHSADDPFWDSYTGDISTSNFPPPSNSEVMKTQWSRIYALSFKQVETQSRMSHDLFNLSLQCDTIYSQGYLGKCYTGLINVEPTANNELCSDNIIKELKEKLVDSAKFWTENCTSNNADLEGDPSAHISPFMVGLLSGKDITKSTNEKVENPAFNINAILSLNSKIVFNNNFSLNKTQTEMVQVPPDMPEICDDPFLESLCIYSQSAYADNYRPDYIPRKLSIFPLYRCYSSTLLSVEDPITKVVEFIDKRKNGSSIDPLIKSNNPAYSRTRHGGYLFGSLTDDRLLTDAILQREVIREEEEEKEPKIVVEEDPQEQNVLKTVSLLLQKEDTEKTVEGEEEDSTKDENNFSEKSVDFTKQPTTTIQNEDNLDDLEELGKQNIDDDDKTEGIVSEEETESTPHLTVLSSKTVPEVSGQEEEENGIAVEEEKEVTPSHSDKNLFELAREVMEPEEGEIHVVRLKDSEMSLGEIAQNNDSLNKEEEVTVEEENERNEEEEEEEEEFHETTESSLSHDSQYSKETEMMRFSSSMDEKEGSEYDRELSESYSEGSSYDEQKSDSYETSGTAAQSELRYSAPLANTQSSSNAQQLGQIEYFAIPCDYDLDHFVCALKARSLQYLDDKLYINLCDEHKTPIENIITAALKSLKSQEKNKEYRALYDRLSKNISETVPLIRKLFQQIPTITTYNLPIYFKPYRTGLEDDVDIISKDGNQTNRMDVRHNMVLGYRYVVQRTTGEAAFSNTVKCIDLVRVFSKEPNMMNGQEDRSQLIKKAESMIPELCDCYGACCGACCNFQDKRYREIVKCENGLYPLRGTERNYNDVAAVQRYGMEKTGKVHSMFPYVCVKIIKNDKEYTEQSLDEIKTLKCVNRFASKLKYYLNRHERLWMEKDKPGTSPVSNGKKHELINKITKEVADKFYPNYLINRLNGNYECDSDDKNQFGEYYDPPIVRLLDYFYCREHLHLVFDLCGPNLYEFEKLYSNKKVYPERYYTIPIIKTIYRQLMEALRISHSLGLIHADLKPENILVKYAPSYERRHDEWRSFRIKLIDFGSASFACDELHSYIQSRSYRAPEVLLDLPYDAGVDIWSAGCMLYEFLTGNVLFPNEDVIIILCRMLGIIGSIPRHMLIGGRLSYKYFTRSLVPYFMCQSEQYYLIPQRTPLEVLLNSPEAPQFVAFNRYLLQYDPEKRPTAEQALAHPFLSTDEL